MVAKSLETPQIYMFFGQMIGLFLFSVTVLGLHVYMYSVFRIPTNNTETALAQNLCIPGKN